VNVVVADGAAHVRSALRLLLEQHTAVTCIAELSTSDGLITEIERHAADVLLVDSQIPDLDLASVVPILHKAYPRLRIVVLSSRMEDRERALHAGADAFVSKGDAPEALDTLLALLAS
jgi:two-component system response regulator DesR